MEYIPPEAENRAPSITFNKPPRESMNSIQIFSGLEGITKKSDDPECIRRAATEAIRIWDSDLTIFTDGSAIDGCRQGGAASVVTIDDSPPRQETVMAKGAPFTSSFEEECQALELAVNWIKANCNAASRPLIITDSQSLCRALEGFNPAVNNLRQQLANCNATIGIQWVPGHCGITGNEDADQAANMARTIPGPQRSTTLSGITSVIKRSIIDPPCRPDQQHIAIIYKKISKIKEKQITCKWDQTYLARLRAGHHWDLRSFLHKLDDTISPLCPRCHAKGDTTLHLFDCPGTMAARQQIFGTVEVPPDVLSTHPQQSITLARRALRSLPVRPGDRRDKMLERWHE